MPSEIPNSKLSEDDLPPVNADMMTIWIFARTFDGYDYIESRPPSEHEAPSNSLHRLSRFANSANAAFHNDKRLPKTLSDLRACLFFEFRRARHLGSAKGGYDEGSSMPYFHALVEAIRQKVRDKDQS